MRRAAVCGVRRNEVLSVQETLDVGRTGQVGESGQLVWEKTASLKP
jgi:hypothetical protein